MGAADRGKTPWDGGLPGAQLAFSWHAWNPRCSLLPPPGPFPRLCCRAYVGGCATEGGLPFVVLEGMVEAPQGSNAWAVLDVAGGAGGGAGVLHICGHGCATSRELPLRAAPGADAGC